MAIITHMRTIGHDGRTGEGCVETGELCETWMGSGRNLVVFKLADRGLPGALAIVDRETREVLVECKDMDEVSGIIQIRERSW